MTNLFFCTTEQVAIFLPDLEIGSSSDATKEAIELDISDKYSELLEIVEHNGYPIDNPTAHQKDVLSLLNQQSPAVKLIFRRASSLPSEIFRYLKALPDLPKMLQEWFRLGYLSHSWRLNSAIEQTQRVALATVEDCTSLVIAFTASDKTKPGRTAIEEWIYQWSALVYSLAAKQGYSTSSNIDLLPTNAARVYRNLVRTIVAYQIYLVQILLFSFADQGDQVLPLATNADSLLKEAKQQFQDFVLGKKKSSFVR
jgi:hypothetical protein